MLFEYFTFGRFGDIDTPACQLGGKPGVLSVFANSQGELPLWYGNDRGMVGFAQLHAQGLHRAERISHKCSSVRTPLDDIDLLVIELMHDVVNTRTSYTNAGPNGIQAF